MPYVVGLTGGIGSGKSAVSSAFENLRVEIADADVAAHAVTAQGEQGHAAVIAAFGPAARMADGNLDRAWLREQVFADPGKRKQLETLLHPLIMARLRAQIAAWTGPYGILSVPLLLERGTSRSLVARVLVVDCPEDEQVRRVMLRSSLSASEVRAIMATQLTREQRLAQADDIVDNGGTLLNIPPQVARLDALYREFAQRVNGLEPVPRFPDNGAQLPEGAR